MNKASKDLTNWCDDISEAIKPAELSECLVGKISLLRNSIEQQELLVSVVGAFSSGKSTLINKIIGDNVLPTAITPETSLATELRYSSEQRIEALKEDGSVTRFDISEIKKVTEDAAKFSYARLYLDSPHIKELEPLVLVDMPGFDSPLDAHNKAIMAYIDRTSHYLVLASVQEGTVSKSLLRRIREIRQLERGLSFFLTKADLKPKSDIDNLVEHFAESLRDDCDYEGEVVAISQSSPDAVVKLLKNINTDSVFLGLYRSSVQGVTDELIDSTNIKISALKRDKASFGLAIVELENTLKKLQAKAQEEIEGLSSRHGSSVVVNNVLLDVGKALEGSLDELVSIAKGGDTAATERYLLDVVRTELNISINTHFGAVNKEIITNLSGSLSSLDKVMRDLEVNNDFTNKLAGVIGSQLTNYGISAAVSGGAGKIAPILASKFLGAGAKVMGIKLGSIVNPLLGIVLAFLPEVLGWLFGSDKEAEKEAKLRSALLGQAFPQIKAKLRPELQQTVIDSLHGMIEQVSAQYEAQISQKRAEFEAVMKEKEVSVAERDQGIVRLEGVRNAVKSASNSLLASYN